MKHFGVTVNSRKYGLELNRETYAQIDNKCSLPKFENMNDAYTDESGMFYTDKWCQDYQQLILQNFDLNMRFFASLDHNIFDNEISSFLKKNSSFCAVTDLNDYESCSGYYIMVLDKYCQLYIGTTDNIKRRIQQHWSKTRNFDRLLFPMYAVNKSIISIDCFRALDTTRIFAYKTNKTYIYENKYISYFSPQFVSNRVSGGFLGNSIYDFLIANGELRSRSL